MFRRLSFVIAAAIVTGSPALGAQQQPPAAARTQIQDFVRAYVDAHNQADATRMMEMVKRDALTTSVSDGEIKRGWEAIRTDTDEIAGLAGSFSFALGTMDVVALGSGFALVVAPLTITVATDKGPA